MQTNDQFTGADRATLENENPPPSLERSIYGHTSISHRHKTVQIFNRSLNKTTFREFLNMPHLTALHFTEYRIGFQVDTNEAVAFRVRLQCIKTSSSRYKNLWLCVSERLHPRAGYNTLSKREKSFLSTMIFATKRKLSGMVLTDKTRLRLG